MTSHKQDKVLQAYIQKFGALPNEPNQLVSFSRGDPTLPTIIYSDAKKALLKIAKSIKGSGQKKKSFKKLLGGPKWQVGDEVLISKDRSGILHYIGKVPEMGNDDIWYGIELTSGTLGQNDGSIKGKRYFQAQGKRGMFIPEKKLRRRLNRKDKDRRNSYAEISGHVRALQKEYAGDDQAAAILYPSSQQNPMTTLVFENPQHAERYGNGGEQFQSSTLHQRQERKDQTDSESEEESPPIQPVAKKKKKKKAKAKKKVTRQRSSSGRSSASRDRRGSHHSHHSHHSKHDTSDSADSDVSDMSDLDNNEDDSSPTVKTFDTLLKYILRQKGQYRQGLLDVYANPQTHALIVEAFSQMKQLKPAEQTFLWPALLKRWSRYTQK
eukprot:190647_1